jgi:catechol 2,3-dioxygenase-like lactoylglutathione lyase family enzyme
MTPSELGEVNVFRRFSSDRTQEMRKFYDQVLGLNALPSSALGGGQMIRYPVGSSEVKLFPSPPSEANTANVGEVIGVRLLTFFFADESELAARFRDHGYPAPEFRARADGARAALAQDPDGEWVELVVLPGAPASALNRFEIGIVVSDLEQSREFYRDFMGLTELAPSFDDLLDAMKYAYKHGSTTINVWTFGPDLPKDAQTAGMQYLVWNVAAVNDVAKARGATIDRPLSDPGQMRTVWLQDPDGVSNYFAEFAGNDNTPPRKAR